MKSRFFALALTAASALATLQGCTSVAKLDTPSGFATVPHDDTFAYRALSAKGVVLATRTEKNDLRGNTDFWSESIDLKLTRAGYTKQGDVEVATARGLKGRQLRYSVERRGREHRYWVTVFLKDDRVVLVEAAGDTEHFKAAEATVERSIATLRVD